MTDLVQNILFIMEKAYSTGVECNLQPEAAREIFDAVAALRAERDAAFAAGMRRAAEVCQNGGADWAYDLIITDLERLEE